MCGPSLFHAQNEINMTVTEQLSTLDSILAHGDIISLFQPIVSLSERRILGYEALSRGPSNTSLHSPINLLTTARHAGRLNELEMVCRENACRRYSHQQLQGKLFLNVSPETLLDAAHRPGRTLELLHKYNISADSVVIELTEQTPTDDFELLDAALHHYRDMGFSIALDDLGAGYSGLRMWSELRPDYVKIDRYFIDGIHRDAIKREFVESIMKIARASRALVIAEGIELSEELEILSDMGIDLVQGYLLGRPEEQARKDATVTLPATGSCDDSLNDDQPGLAELVQKQSAVNASHPAGKVLEMFRLQPSLNSVAVLDASNAPVGIVHRNLLSEALLKPFATDLLTRKPIAKLMTDDFLAVELGHSLQQVSRLLTSRARQRIDEEFIITVNGTYHGLGRVIDVLKLITEMKVRQAQHANPLTLLPGNVPIQQCLTRLLKHRREAIICYVDIDNFKPFNDLYGYAKGDEILLCLAHCLNELIDTGLDFVGHIGGDDFMLVIESRNWSSKITRLFEIFERRCKRFYRSEHLAEGSFIAEARQGGSQRYPLLSLSIGAVPLKPDAATHLDAALLASLASEAKHHAKQEPGFSLHVLDPELHAASHQSPNLAALTL